MHKIFLIGILLAASLCSFAQEVAPGGVAGYKWWYQGQAIAPGQEKLPMLNFHPVAALPGGANGLQVPLPQLNLAKTSVFTVAKAADTLQERIIWSLEDAKKQASLVLSTHRLADLADYRYLNFVAHQKDLPTLHAYLQYKEDTERQVAQVLRVGAKPSAPQLPIAAFNGLLPEMLVYDRVLDAQERLRVESYLSLKYGLNLKSQGLPVYADSRGDTIWNGFEHPTFTHHLAGIGRDERSGLYQKQAESSLKPGFLQIAKGNFAPENALNSAQLAERSFLLWADDGQDAQFASKQMGQPLQLKTRWLIKTVGNIEGAFSLKINTVQLPPLPPKHTWWLAIDQSGNGNFAPKSTIYQAVNELSPEGMALFQNLHWDADGSRRDQFTLAAGPDLLGIAQVEQPDCQKGSKGKMEIGAWGGLAPYAIEVRGENTRRVEQFTARNQQSIDLLDLEPDAYTVKVKDARGQVFQDSFFVGSQGMPDLKLPAQVALRTGESLTLSPAKFSGVEWQWTSPNGNTSNNPDLKVTEVGTYQLSWRMGNCFNRQSIQVLDVLPDPFLQAVVFPNPAPAGAFQLEVKMKQAQELELRIFDANGRLLKQQDLGQSAHQRLSQQVTEAGTYTLQLRSGSTQKSLKVIVQ
jgi:Secretion system C-terminal sorting domain